MKRNSLLVCLFISLALIALVACGGNAESPAAGEGIAIEGAWARPPAMPGGNAAAYFVVANDGDEADRLIGAGSDLGVTEIHESMMGEDGMMSMRPVEGVDIAAGESVEFKPGGLHIMFIGVAEPPAVGDTVQVTLTFERAGDITLDVPVREE